MTRPAKEPSARDMVTLEDDPDFRRDIVVDGLEAASKAGLHIDPRVQRLLDQYVEGAISFDELQRQVMRPFVH